MIRRRSAMGPLQLALDTALQGTASVTAIVGDRVYSLGTVPKDAPVPYVELGDSSERSSGYFGQGGNINDETLTIVTPKAGGKVAAGEALAAITDALDRRALPMDGHAMLSGRLELITVFVDPDVTNVRSVCRYTVTSWTTAGSA